MKNRAYIGVDFGGTKILAGAMNSEGEMICEPVQVPTMGSDSRENILNRLTGAVKTVVDGIDTSVYETAGIGLGVTGPLDIKNGVILDCPQLPALQYFALRKEIENSFSVPVYMNNDANCLIFGEALFGAGAGKNIVAGFTLGTGLGCALVIDQKIFNGHTESAGEIWTSPYGSGIIEDFTSGSGVSRIYNDICGANKSALEISVLAENGDANAVETWKQYGRHLAYALAWTINLIDPEVVILGGSVSKAYKFFAASLEENLRSSICSVPAEKLRIVTAALGSNAGLIGAASLALKKI